MRRSADARFFRGYCTGFHGARQAFTLRVGARRFAEARPRSGSNSLASGTPLTNFSLVTTSGAALLPIALCPNQNIPPSTIARPEASSSDVLIDEDRVSVRIHGDKTGGPRRALVCFAR